MANAYYERGSSFNPDELADGDAIEAEFDAVVRGFDTIETQIDTDKAGYPTQTFHVAPATEPTHAIQQAQLDAQTHVSADITDATSIPTPNVLVKRDVNGDIGARNFVGGLVGNADSASRAVGNTFFTAGSDSEGQIGTNFNGHKTTYLFNNASNWGVFCADGGMAFNFSYSTGLFRFYGTANEALKVTDVVPIGEERNLVYAQMGGDDFFRIRAYASGYDQGEVEIATADGGNEPIHVRQYDGVFSSVRRTLTLLGADGHTRIPQNCYANGFDIKDGGQNAKNGLYSGNTDGASSSGANVVISSWFGVGFSPSVSGQPVPINEMSHWFDTRSGNGGMRGTLAQWSDERLKTEITVIPNAIAKVNALRGVIYTRKDSGERCTGMIAQEVQAVLPEAVTEGSDENKTLSVAYGNTVGLLVEAIKELAAKVEILESRVGV